MATMINPLDPAASQLEQMSADRQRAIANMLMQQSMESPQGQMISGHYVAPSWTQQAARLAQGVTGRSMNDQIDKRQLDYQQQSMAGLIAALGQPQGQLGQGPTPQPSTPGQLGSGMMGDVTPQGGNVMPDMQPGQPAQPPQPNALNPRGFNPQMAARMLMADPAKYWEAQANQTDATKTAVAAGVDPLQANRDALFKSNYIAPVNARAGSILRDPRTNMPMAFNPTVPEGGSPVFDASGNVVRVDPLAGVTGVVSALEAAKARGKNLETVAPKDLLPTNADGTVTPRSLNATLHPDNAGFPAGTQVPQPTNVGQMVKGQSDTLSILQQERANAKPADIPAIDREIAREKARQQSPSPQGVGAPFGAETSGKGNAEIVNTHYAGLTAANANAPMELAALQNIKKYAPGAITGAQSDQRAFINGLATLIPGWHPGMDTKTETDLFNKNAARMVAGAGNTGGATDAFNKIKEAANPNNHMSVDAVNEAVDQLSALKRMSLDTQAILDPLKQSNNVQGYQSTLTKINKVADPRIWELNAMTPQKQGAFINSLSPQDAKELLQKRAALKQLGVFNGSN